MKIRIIQNGKPEYIECKNYYLSPVLNIIVADNKEYSFDSNTTPNFTRSRCSKTN